MSTALSKEQLNARRSQLEQRLRALQEEEKEIRRKICKKYGHVFSLINFEYLYDTPKPSFFAGKHAMYEVTERCECCGTIAEDARCLPVKYVKNVTETPIPDEMQEELKKSLSRIISQRKKFASELHTINIHLCALIMVKL